LFASLAFKIDLGIPKPSTKKHIKRRKSILIFVSDKDEESPLRKNLACLIAAAVVAASLVVANPAAKTRDEVVESIWTHTGGKSAFQSARYLKFTWAVEKDGRTLRTRRHLWDRYTGQYVLETPDGQSGDALTVYFNVNDKTGKAFNAGELLTGSDAAEAIENAYAAFINDTYWLIAHVKLEDPGVNVSVETDDAAENGKSHSVLHLTFDGVGLTPGDQYWLYVDSTGRVTRWRFLLQSGQEGDFEWKDERDCGMGLRFATNKVSADGTFRIHFPDATFTRSVPPGAFDPPK
jgi:hypothetical protein